jgi:hypothetical protein
MTINRVTVSISNSTGSWSLTDYVLNVDISLGKNAALDSYEPGTCTVSLKNFNREFDPLNTSSSFYGAILPKNTDVDIVLNGSYRIFTGNIDDFSFDYNVSNESTVTFNASEFSSIFVKQNLFSTSFPQEYSGSRVSRVLDDDGVAYSTAVGARTIYPGTQLLDADTNCFGVNALDYLKNIEISEQGSFYYNSDGTFWFDDNSVSLTSTGVELFTDDGALNYSYGAGVDSYPYTAIDISYTSQLLYNRINVNSNDGLSTVTADESNSQNTYDKSLLTVDGILYNDSTRLLNLASYLTSKYSQPEYRINSVTVNYGGLSTAIQNRLALKLQNVNVFAKVRFTPNKVGTAIEKYVRIIGIKHSISPSSHEINYMFESIKTPNLVLDDTEFGKLDTGRLGL